MPLLTQNGFCAEITSDYVDVPNDTDPQTLVDELAQTRVIRLHFPSFADGRAFSQARRLRDMGFCGIIRASGHLMPDQRPFAEQCGIDEFELSESLLLRTTEQAWLNSTSAPNYRAHLSGERV